MRSVAASSVGSSPVTCAPRSSWTRCGRRSVGAGPAPTSPWSTTPIRQPIHLDHYTQTLADRGVLVSVESVGDAYDNALAEGFVDSFKTELIADRACRTRAQLELAVVEYIGWFNDARLHQALDDRPPSKFEHAEPDQ